MRQKRCKLCGCFMWTNDSDICDVCIDDMAESEEDEDNGTGEDV